MFSVIAFLFLIDVLGIGAHIVTVNRIESTSDKANSASHQANRVLCIQKQLIESALARERVLEQTSKDPAAKMAHHRNVKASETYLKSISPFTTCPKSILGPPNPKTPSPG